MHTHTRLAVPQSLRVVSFAVWLSKDVFLRSRPFPYPLAYFPDSIPTLSSLLPLLPLRLVCRHLSAVTISCNIAILGLSLYAAGWPAMGACIQLGLPVMCLMCAGAGVWGWPGLGYTAMCLAGYAVSLCCVVLSHTACCRAVLLCALLLGLAEDLCIVRLDSSPPWPRHTPPHTAMHRDHHHQAHVQSSTFTGRSIIFAFHMKRVKIFE